MKLSRAACLVALVAVSALADKANDEAKVRFKRGAELYDEGNFRGALIEFQRAHQLVPNYKILYNIGQVQLQLLDYARASDVFSRYLKEGGADLAQPRRDEVNRELERLKARIGRIAVTTIDGAEVLIDDESAGFAPLAGSIAANTGRHKVTVVPPGQPPQTRLVEVAGLETVTVVLAAEAPTLKPAAPPTTTPSEPLLVTRTTAQPAARPSRLPMIVGWSATGVAAATAVVFGLLALSASNDLRNLRGTFGVTPGQLTTASSSVGAFAAVADVSTLVAIVGGIVSLVLTFTGPPL